MAHTCAAMYVNATVFQSSNNPEWRIWEKHLDLMVRVHRCIRHQIKHSDPSLSHKLYLTLSPSLYDFPALRLLRCCGNKLCGGGDAAHITRVSLSSPEEGEKCEGDRDKWLGLIRVCVCVRLGWGNRLTATLHSLAKKGRVEGKYFDVQKINLKALWPAVCELGRDTALQQHFHERKVNVNAVYWMVRIQNGQLLTAKPTCLFRKPQGSPRTHHSNKVSKAN